jgi:acetyltransferase-like isoleucine patch superfamily enzyme
LITSNHDLKNPALRSDGKPIILGEQCWIGMNSVILPGVILGPHTVVGAGSVVTKSYPVGYCVLVGNPAKLLKYIEQE